MLRELDFNEISDGKFYQSQDMVRADCGGCKGCSSCCRGMGSSIVPGAPGGRRHHPAKFENDRPRGSLYIFE